MTDQILSTDEGQSIGIGAHICAMHEVPDARLDTLAQAFAAGLKRGELCAI